MNIPHVQSHAASLSDFAQPEKIVAQLPIRPGSIVADLGAGVGHFAIPISRMVGDKGKVYAVDIQKELIVTLGQQAQKANRHNIDIVWGDLERIGGTRLKDGLCDAVLIINTLFLIQDKDTFIEEVLRITKSGGDVYCMDWSDSFGGVGPDPRHVVTDEQARALFEQRGCTFQKNFDAGSHHYGMMFKKHV